ncbi:MAG: winged helix-turn-helix domain-containing protein [Betaproteobacteria bacterium]
MNSDTDHDAPAAPPPRSATPAGMKIGDFAIDASSHEIHGPAGVVRLRPLIMNVLLRLAQTPGATVSREQLIADVWSRKIVNDEVLSRAIGELRTALGDDSKDPRYIETLPKVGYRLVARVEYEVAPVTQNVLPVAEKNSPAVVGNATPGRGAFRVAIGASALAGVCLIAVLAYRGMAAPKTAAEPDWAKQVNAATPFASDPAAELSPRFSADGKYVAYVMRHDDRSDLVIQEVSGGSRKVVNAGPGYATSPVFFPDGKRIAYWRQLGDDCEIIEHTLAGDAKKQLLDCKLNPASRFDLSPDGTRLVFASRENKEYPSALMLQDIATAKLTRLTQPQPGEGSDILPRFSPDGTRIAFFRGSESHQRVWLVDAAPPHAAKAATTVEGLSYGLAWAAPQGPLLVAADWHGFRALNHLDLTSGQSRLLGARGARFPDIAADGTLIFESATYRADLWLTDAREPGKQQQILWPSTRYSNQPEFSPDGKTVVFSSNRESSDGLFVGTLGGDAKRLPLPASFRYIRPHWSPDGRAILTVRIATAESKPSQQQAVRFDVASGQHEILSRAGNAVNAVHALANGDLLVGEIADYAMRLFTVPAGGGEKKRLALPLVSEYAVNGNTLVYTLPQLTGATRCELDTLRCTPLKIDLDDNNRFDWTLARDAIWYLGRTEQGQRALMRFDLSTGQTASHGFAPSGAGTSLATGPDGTQLIVVREAPPVIDLMLAAKVPSP